MPLQAMTRNPDCDYWIASQECFLFLGMFFIPWNVLYSLECSLFLTLAKTLTIHYLIFAN